MPFSVEKARSQTYEFEFEWGEEKLTGRYNAGEKYARLEDKVNARALASIKKGAAAEGETPKTLRQRKLEECELLSIVLEEWDVEQDDVIRALALIDYFKAQARRVFGTLYGFDYKKRLLEDVSRFVAREGGVWIGTATDLHQQFHSDYKPKRREELSKFIKEAAEDEEGFTYASEMDRMKDEETGKWESRRVLTLYIGESP